MLIGSSVRLMNLSSGTHRRVSAAGEVVIDPEVPDDDAADLQAADAGHLIPFGAPVQQAGREPRSLALFWKAVVSAGLGAALATAGALLLLTQLGRPADWMTLVYLMMVAWGFSGTFFSAMIAIFQGRKRGRRRMRRLVALGRRYHRRYVLPKSDLDAEATQAWSRAFKAVNRIACADVVRQRRIDSDQLLGRLPSYLWNIAQQLASLSALRAEQGDILSGVDSGDPEVDRVLGLQRDAHELAAADVERQVRLLEAFAGRMGEADAAVRRSGARRRLAALDDSHADLLARIGRPDADIGNGIADDLQAVIDQVEDAVSHVNECGPPLPPAPGQDTTGGQAPPSTGG